jgi:hypothetical protein
VSEFSETNPIPIAVTPEYEITDVRLFESGEFLVHILDDRLEVALRDGHSLEETGKGALDDSVIARDFRAAHLPFATDRVALAL